MIVKTYEIRCDGCGIYYDFDSEVVSYVEKRAKQSGWLLKEAELTLSMDLNGNRMTGKYYKHYCPKCKEVQS